MRWLTRLATGGVLTVALAAGSGCVDLKAVQTFADSTKALAASSDQFYDQVYKANRELRAFSNAQNNSTDPPPAPGDPFEAAVAGPGLSSEIRRHRAAVAALDAYAKGLNDLATLNEDDAIKKSAGALGMSLVAAKNVLSPSSASTDTDKKLEADLASVIEAVANLYIDVRKQQILRQKIKEAQPHVAAILDMLVKDIAHQASQARAQRSVRQSTRATWFGALVPATGNTPPLNGLAAAQLVRNEIDDRDADAEADAFVAKLKKAAKTCNDAQDALGQDRVNVDAVIAFYNDAKDLVSSAGKLSKDLK